MNRFPKAGIEGASNKMMESFKRNKLFFAGCACAGMGAAIGPFPYVIGGISGVLLMAVNGIKNREVSSWPVFVIQTALSLGIGFSAYGVELAALKQEPSIKSQIEILAASELLDGKDKLTSTYSYEGPDGWNWRSRRHEKFLQAEVVARKDNAVDVRVQFDGEEPYRKLFIREMLDQKYKTATIVPR